MIAQQTEAYRRVGCTVNISVGSLIFHSPPPFPGGLLGHSSSICLTASSTERSTVNSKPLSCSRGYHEPPKKAVRSGKTSPRLAYSLVN